MIVFAREPGWVIGNVSEISEGDLVEVRGRHYRVMMRTYPHAMNPTVRITIPNGSEACCSRRPPIKIFDLW